MRDSINTALENWRHPVPDALRQDCLGFLYRRNANFLFTMAILAHLAFYSYAFADFLLVPEIFNFSIIVRTFFILLILPLNLYLIRKVKNIIFLEWMFAVCIIGATILWLGVLLPRTDNPVVSFYLYASIIFVVVINLVIRANFYTALSASLLHTAITFYFVNQLEHGNTQALFVFSIVYMPVLYFSIFIGWHNTRTARRLFLYSVIEHMDKAELQAANKRLWLQSHTDTLTGLPNRMLFDDRLQQSLVQAKRNPSRFALLFIDLDKFKPVNDQFGHAAGDILLKQVAERIRASLRESDTVARIGGDEFIALLPMIDDIEDARRVADKVCTELNLPFALSPQLEVTISASIGVATYPENGSTPIDLLRSADLALYRAKNLGRNQVVTQD